MSQTYLPPPPPPPHLPALANISSASVFKPVSKSGSQGVCKVALN